MELLKDRDVWDIVIVGAGPAGLMAAIDLIRPDVKILVIGDNNFLGSGSWTDSMLSGEHVLSGSAREILDEFEITHAKIGADAYTAGGMRVYSRLIAAVSNGGVKILNSAAFKDLIYTDKIEGVVLTLPPGLQSLPGNKEDLVSLKCYIVLDTIGVDLFGHSDFKEIKRVCGQAVAQQGICVNSDELIKEKSGSIYSGLFVAGRAAAKICGILQNDLSLESLLFSGRKAAGEAEIFLAEMFTLPPKTHAPDDY